MQSQPPVYLHAIGSAVPANRLPQAGVLEFMKRPHAAHPARLAFLDKVYSGSAIEWRHSVLPDFLQAAEERSFFPASPNLEPSPSTGKRNQRYSVEAPLLAEQACRKLFATTGLLAQAPDITHLITVSCTGFSAPGVDLALIKTLGLGADVQRSHLGFMGCNAALPAFSLATDIARAHPEARILVVSVELCSLHFQTGWNTEQIVASALFADGAAAALISARFEDSGAPLYALGQRQSRILPDSAARMAWTIGDTGFDMVLSAYVPQLIRQHLDGLLGELITASGVQRGQIRHWAIHPGGRAILDHAAECLALPPQALAPSFAVLREYGNMSSATLFFVLERLAAEQSGKSGEAVFTSSFGPGLSVESAMLELRPRLPKRRQARFFPKLALRSLEPELMDDRLVEPSRLNRTFRQFGLINRLFSAYRPVLSREVFGRVGDPARSYRLLDLGCGSGDILAWVAAEAKSRGLRFELIGLDPDPAAVAQARQRFAAAPEVSIVQGSSDQLAELAERLGGFDFIISNHVLHHLGTRRIRHLVAECQRLARVNLVLNDLARSAWAYLGYTIFAGLFLHRSLARYDGKLSIRRGFLRAELEGMLDQIGLADRLRVASAAPARLIICRRPAVDAPLPASDCLISEGAR